MRMRTRKDIFAIKSSGRLKASASAACRYRSWAKLHISLARCTSQPSEMAICRPRIERRFVLVDLSLVVGRLPFELRSSSVSKSLLLLFDGLSWSITAATSVVLNLQRRKFRRGVAKVQRGMDLSSTHVAPKHEAHTRYFRASTGSFFKCDVRYETSLGSTTSF
jgi:hypothetical protein